MDRFFSYSPSRSEITAFGRTFSLPKGRTTRIALGGGLVVGGCLGFLPVLGFWMIPLGVLVLSQDIPRIRRMRRKFVVRGRRGNQPRKDAARDEAPAPTSGTDGG